MTSGRCLYQRNILRNYTHCQCQLETLIRDCQCQLESFAMWRFLANITDPNDPKDKQSKAKDRKEEYKEYESKKRSRSYQTA